MYDIAGIIREIAILAVPFLLAITCHEVAHGYVAYRLGDPTAKNAGRLTLNPLKHLDPLGTVVLVLTRFIGWAKPVPVDPRYFKDPYKGMMLTSLAGPGANLALAVLFSLGMRLILAFGSGRNLTGEGFSMIEPIYYICEAGVFINIVLCCFNLIPVPPLDGSKVLAYFLPRSIAGRFLDFGKWGFFVVLLLLATGVLQNYVLVPMVLLLRSIILM